MKTINLITYPIVVIESMWPKLPEEAPKIVGTSATSANLLKPTPLSGAFSGYYRIIPLNILGIHTTSSLDGHSFNIAFDPSYVYIDFSPENFPIEIANSIRQNALSVDSRNLHALVGVLGTLSNQDLYSNNAESYIVPFDIVSTLVNELDTVTIYQISDVDIFDFPSLVRIGGGSFSRISPSQTNAEIRQLKAFGLPEQKPELETTRDLVTVFRSYLGGIGILTYFDISGTKSHPYDPTTSNYLDSAKRVQRKILVDFFNEKIGKQELLSAFPEIVAERIYSGVYTKNQILQEYDSYYASKPQLSALLPFGWYKALDITLAEVFGNKSTLDQIALTAAIDTLLAKLNPALFSKIREDYTGSTHINAAIEFLNSTKISQYTTVTSFDYMVGLRSFSLVLEDYYDSLANKYDSNILAIEDVSKLDGKVSVPISSETPYTLLKGHVTRISTSTAVNAGSLSKTTTISGEGLEAPLKRHTVFFDNASANKYYLQLTTQYAVINSTPIEAAKHILKTFMPEYVKLEELTKNDTHEAVQHMRDYSVFVQGSGKKVAKGALVIPDLLGTSDTAYIFAPISYISTDYLAAIQPAFDEIAIYERKAQILTYAPEGPVAQVLNEFLGKSSIYNWHIDELGYLRVRFELGQTIVPTDSVLSPFISDIQIKSLNTSLDESRIYTLVEVVPRGWSFSSPSEGNIAGLFSRAVPPSIAEEEALYTKLELPSIQNKLDDVSNWIGGVLNDFNAAVLRAIHIVNKDKLLTQLSTLGEVYNSTTPKKMLETINKEGELTTVDAQEKLFNPSSLAGLYLPNSPALTALLAYINNDGKYVFTNSPQGFLTFRLNNIITSHPEAFAEIVNTLQLSILKHKPNWVADLSVRGGVISSWIQFMSTLAAMGVTPTNATSLLRTDKIIQAIISNSTIYINAKTVKSKKVAEQYLPDSVNPKILPYTEVEIQDLAPENTSADLYRYGLRIHRTSDNYLSTLRLTKFRSEFLRKVHEKPILTANVQIIGNPRYKIGNTVLVESRETQEVHGNYITEGLRKTFYEIAQDNAYLDLFLGTDTVLLEDIQPPYSNIFTSIKQVTSDTLTTHFTAAMDFILSASNGLPVPASAYVPTLGIYQTENQLVNEYLDLLVKLQLPEYAHVDKRNYVHKRLLNIIKDLTVQIFGQDTISNRNKILQLLEPQTYHAAQYYIQNVQNNWNFGAIYTTNLSLDYGRPVLLTKIDERTIGYLVTDTPVLLYNSKGIANPVIKKDNPLYLSLISQVSATKTFYSNTLRYKATRQLDIIKENAKEVIDVT